MDPGYAVVPRLLAHLTPGDVDAVFVTHRHPDHCADLNPLLRARTMSEGDLPALPVFSPPDALDAVLALDRQEWLAVALALHEFEPGSTFETGPFRAETRPLPHSVPNAGVRLTAAGRTVAYTGDTGPSPDVVTLARDADVLLAEASYVDADMPKDLEAVLSTAQQAGQHAAAAGVAQLVLTHLIPGTEPDAALEAARMSFSGEIRVARPGLVVDVA